ncbi:MAG TPA: hypothetical protein VGR73_18275 [Bryobacteraceae bacterium]|nr:hypothetical protein [Bryobacteraceae bacterium]
MRHRFRYGTIGIWIALLAPVLIEIFGFRTAHLWSQEIWFLPEGARRFGYYVLAFAVISTGFALFLRRYYLPVLVGAVVLCSIQAVGPGPVGAVLLFIFSATILGRVAFGGTVEGPLACMGGIAIWIVALTCTIRFPIHYPATYLAALALPPASAYPLSRQLASRWINLFRANWRPSNAEFVCFALAALVLGADWLVVLNPEISADGLAMHMAAASNIAIHHAFTVDFRQFIWALMPMGADWCYSVVYTLGGEYAARLLNFAMLGAIGLLLLGVARRFVSNAVALLTVFLFLSTPMVLFVTGSLLVENFAAAMILAAGVALWKFDDEGGTQMLFMAALLLGAGAEIKFGAVAAALMMTPFLFAAIWRNWHRLRRPAWVPVCAIVLSLAIAALPYANAYWRSGNPIFPFQNARFHSPYVGNEIPDVFFHPPLTWRAPVLLTFRTSRYFQGQNGSFGLQYFLFLPLTLASLLWMRSFVGFSCAAIGIGGGLVLIATAPDARYLYPVLPFLSLGATAALSGLQTSRRRIYQAGVLAATAAGLWNTYYFPSADWYHKDFFSSPLFSAAGRQSYLRKHAPVRELIAYVNRVDPSDPVVLTDSSSIAGLIPPVYTNNWHDYRFWKQIQAFQDPEAFYRHLSHLGVRRLIVEPSSFRAKVIDVLLTRCGQPEYSVSGSSVVRMRPDCLAVLQGVDAEPLRTGRIDETDPRIVLTGNWIQMRDLPSAYRNTVAVSDDPEARVRFNLEGRGFRYSYTRAFNRGRAEIVIDGERKAIVDLYDPAIVWQAHSVIAGLPPGSHRVAIHALHQKDPAANGYFIDVDSIEPLP